MTTDVQGAGSASRPATAPLEETSGGLQIRNILCPVDFTEFSDEAFRYAQNLAWHFKARLLLHHTVSVPRNLLMGTMDVGVMESAYQAELQTERGKLAALAASAELDKEQIATSFSEGEPITNILEIIKTQRIDLVVLGTHGHKGFNHLVLGSVAEHVIHEAVCPVLVVSKPRPGQTRFRSPRAFEPFPLRTILLATDFSPSSDRALTYALRWASEWGGKVVVFHAVEKVPAITQGRVDLFPEYNPAFEEQIARAWEQMRRLIPESAQRSCEVLFEVRHGQPKEEILRVAEEKNADLIVTGARGAGKGTSLWGSNSSAVVRAARFPVLVVRQLPG
ncbi:MAG TPA: universal stress protein [Terriglobia bacterium]|nr:universal stress protein [Terriglobia bacterium]